MNNNNNAESIEEVRVASSLTDNNKNVHHIKEESILKVDIAPIAIPGIEEEQHETVE